MKFISITKFINIRPDWASIGARLKAGTPLDITGAVANSSAAVGILADDAEKSSAEVAVVTEGLIDLAEVAASYGELTDDCIAAIKGISFIDANGDPIVPSGGAGGNAEWNDALKNIVIVTLDVTSDHEADLICACSDGVVIGQMYFETDGETGDINIGFGEWSNSEENPVPVADFSSITAALETAIFSHYYPLVPNYYIDISDIEQRIIVCR